MSAIHFGLRKDKPDKFGQYPLDLIYSVSNQRKRYYTGVKLFLQYWNKNIQKIEYLDKRAAKQLLPNIDFNTLLSLKEVDELDIKFSDIATRVLKGM